MSTRTLLLSHGVLADELLATTRSIVGNTPHVDAISVPWSEGLEEIEARLQSYLDAIDPATGVLVLVDLHGSSPCTVALRHARSGRVAVVTGVNLPLVVRLATRQTEQDPELEELARWAAYKGRSGIKSQDELV